jgi:hypothetical protein
MSDAMQWAYIGRDYLWPAGVIIIVVLLFREPIASFLRDLDLFRAGAGGAEFRRRSVAQAPPPTPPDGDVPAEPPPAPPSGPDATVQQLQAYVYYWYYEKTYRIIFGSQIRCLRQLNVNKVLGATAQDIESYWKEYRERAKAISGAYEFDQFIGFLVNARLAEKRGDRYFITELGVGFLQWITAEGVDDKPWGL